MGFFSWVILGLVAGVLAQWLVPIKRKGGCAGCLLTIIIGLIGAAVGGLIGAWLGWGTVDSLDVRGIALASVGAVVVLLLLRAIQERR